MSKADTAIVDAIADAINDYSEKWVIFGKEDVAAIAEYLESKGWIVLKDEADANANGYFQRGP